jgi:hypothetical protein
MILEGLVETVEWAASLVWEVTLGQFKQAAQLEAPLVRVAAAVRLA